MIKLMSLKIRLYNPLLLYVLIWTLVLFLYTLKFTNNIIGINTSTEILVYSSIVSFSFIYSIFYFIRIKNNSIRINKFRGSIFSIFKFKKILNTLFSIWFILTFIEILHFKGVPLISVLVFKDYGKDYTTFGLPTLHGLLNACYFTITTGQYIYYKYTGDKSSLVRFRYLLLWPIFLMSRALLLWILIEYLCCYLFFNKLNIQKIFKILIVLFSFITIFGLIGDNRSENSEIRFTDKFISDQYQDIANVLPSGFVWVYLYATTPLNNIVYNIENLAPKYDFYYTFAALIPSFLREKFYPKNSSGTLVLYEEAFNVSSYFSNYLFDLGIIGTIIFVALLQFIVCLVYFSAKSMKVGSIISYSAIFYALFTSVFFDNFISLVTIFQIFIGATINYILYYKKNEHV